MSAQKTVPYASYRSDHDTTVVYDPENPMAWIESNLSWTVEACR